MSRPAPESLVHPVGEHEPPKGFFRTYIFSIDHKIIGIQFLFTGLVMFLLGGLLAIGIRWQLAWPFQEIPLIGKLLWRETGGVMPPEFFVMLTTMHGTIMVFFVLVPILVGGFGNFLIPLMIGAKDMAFPVLNAISYWLFAVASGIILAAFFVEGGAAGGGWTAYPPLSAVSSAAPGSGLGQTLWLISLTAFGFASIFGAINYITTVLNLRTRGMRFRRLPIVIWALFFTAILILLVTPVIAVAFIMLLFDRTLGTSFFLPQGVLIGDQLLSNTGGQPLLYQHLFWFFGHPEVYILIMPAWGIVAEILPVFARKPSFGYRSTVIGLAAVGILSFIVWGHHMYVSGMSAGLGKAFMLTTILISVPSFVITFNWLATLWRGSIRFTTPMLHALSVIAMFMIGGGTGIFLASAPVNTHLHGTYFVVAHFHYTVFGGSTFGAFAAITYWFPKMFGRMLDERLGKIHALLTLLFFNGVTFPMFFLGVGGMMRRIADPTVYDFLKPHQDWNVFITISAIGLGLVQLIFVYNFVKSLLVGKRAPENPWESNTLEWTAPSPPPHGNFPVEPVIFRDPYEYSPPREAAASDFIPQHVADTPSSSPA